MEQGETRYINNQLYYYNVSDSKWYPVPMRVVGGGGRKTIIQGGGGDPSYAQTFVNQNQSVSANNPVIWKGIQNNVGITLNPAGTGIVVEKAGTYQIDFFISAQSEGVPN